VRKSHPKIVAKVFKKKNVLVSIGSKNNSPNNIELNIDQKLNLFSKGKKLNITPKPEHKPRKLELKNASISLQVKENNKKNPVKKISASSM
jgi:hypothetical protein